MFGTREGPTVPVSHENICPPVADYGRRRGRPHNYEKDKNTIRCFKCGCFGHDGKTCTKTKGESSGVETEPQEEKCWVCGCLGHHAKNCKQKTVTCFSCGAKGHKQADCTSFMANCWNCGQSGHIKRDCPHKENMGMCFNCSGVGHHSNACPNRTCHQCGKKGHLKNDCPLNNQKGAYTGHQSDSEIVNPMKYLSRRDNSKSRSRHNASLSADEYQASHARRGFNPQYGFIAPPAPNQAHQPQPQYQYQQHAMWGQQGLMSPTSQYQGNLYQQYPTWAGYQISDYGQNAQQNMPNGAPMLTGRRVSRPVFTEDSQSESSFAGSGVRQYSRWAETNNDLLSIAGSHAGSVADDEQTDNDEGDAPLPPKAVPNMLKMKTMAYSKQENGFNPTAKEFTPRGYLRKKSKKVEALPIIPSSKQLELPEAAVPPVMKRRHGVNDEVIANVNGKHWFGKIISRNSNGTFDIEVEQKDGTTEIIREVSKAKFVEENALESMPSVINDIKMTASGKEFLKKRVATPRATTGGSESDDETPEEEDDTEMVQPAILEEDDEDGLQLPNFDAFGDDDNSNAATSPKAPRFPNTPKDQIEDCIQEEGDESKIFTFDEEHFQSFASKKPNFGSVLGEIVFKNQIASFPGETWQEVCRRTVEWLFETQRRHCVDKGIKWDASKADRRSKELFMRLFDMQVLPSAKFLRWATRAKDYDNVSSLSFFDNGFVSTQISEKNKDKPGRPFGFYMECLLNAVNIGYDTRICEGHSGEKFVVQMPAPPQGRHILIKTLQGWASFLEKFINSYLTRGVSEPQALFHTQLPVQHQQIINSILSKTRKAFHQQLGKEITETTVISIMAAMNSSFSNVASAVIRNEAKSKKAYPDGSQPDFCKSNPVIDLKADADNDWEGILKREFTDKQNDDLSIVFTDNMKKVFRFSDSKRSSIRNLNVQGANPGCDMTLESFELASKVEIFLPRCDCRDTFLYACKYAVLIAKTINLLKIPAWPETTTKLQNNSRTGIGLCGITAFLAKEKNNYSMLKGTCTAGYDFIKQRNAMFAKEFKTAESITQTSVNLQQKLTLLTGVPAGMSYLFSRYSLRTVYVSAEQAREYKERGFEASEIVVDSVELEFVPGKLGIEFANDGRIRRVDGQGQAKELGVQVGWLLTHVNREPFTEQRLREAMGRAIETGSSHVLTFRTPYPQTHYTLKVPVDAGPHCERSLWDVPCAEQLQLCVFLNEFWSDNAVNAPIPFDEEKELNMLPMLLRTNQFKLKSVKFWRHRGRTEQSQALQNNYTPLTKDEYERYTQKLICG